MRRAILTLLVFSASCRQSSAPPSPPPALPVAGLTCARILPPAQVRAILGHPVTYRQVRHRSGAYRALSCENAVQRPLEVFAFDVGCGIGARARFVAAVRSVRDAIRLTPPKVGAEAYASRNVYLSWFPRRNCYSTVLMSWRRPNPESLRKLAAKVELALRRP